jgi:anti-anti-sigma factor
MEGSLLGRPSETLAVDVFERGTGTAVIIAHGVIDLATHPLLEGSAGEAIDSGDTVVILDLSGVTLCDSTGLSALIRLHRRAGAAGGQLRLAGVQPQVRRVLEITDLTRLLAIYDTVTDARAEKD